MAWAYSSTEFDRNAHDIIYSKYKIIWGVDDVALGSALREARTSLGVSLEEAHKATKIRRVYLEALEREDFSKLPSQVYIAGFIRIYSRYLGLEPDELVASVPSIDPGVLTPLPEVEVPSPPVASWLVGSVIVLLMVLLGLRLGSQASGSSDLESASALESSKATKTAKENSPILSEKDLLLRLPDNEIDKSRPSISPQGPIIAVPSLIGRPFSDAERALTAAGLVIVKRDALSEDAPNGVILRQEPQGGQKVSKGSTVTLIVSRGSKSITVPDVIGRPEGLAKEVISGTGLSFSPWVNYQGVDQLPPDMLRRVCVGCVLSITPSPGEAVPAGTAISMAVRRE